MSTSCIPGIRSPFSYLEVLRANPQSFNSIYDKHDKSSTPSTIGITIPNHSPLPNPLKDLSKRISERNENDRDSQVIRANMAKINNMESKNIYRW